MALPRLRLRTSNCSLLLIYLPRKDERLSWPGWLVTCRRITVEPKSKRIVETTALLLLSAHPGVDLPVVTSSTGLRAVVQDLCAACQLLWTADVTDTRPGKRDVIGQTCC